MSFSINQVSYQYGEENKPVLHDVSFDIIAGQVTAIVGPSGCGKSTLVSILSGVIPDLMPNGIFAGTIGIAKDILISVVSQSPENQLFGYGVEDAIAFGIENMGLDTADISERVEYVLDLLNIQHLRRRSISTLSGGQRQAVCIASVLAMRPEILIMDEPVSSLDPNGKKMIQSVLGALRETGQTTIIVDNNLDWFSGIVDHVIGLIGGEVVFDGDKGDFFADFNIQERLGVTIPQEAEIYRELARLIPGLNPFATFQEAKREIGRLIGSTQAPVAAQAIPTTTVGISPTATATNPATATSAPTSTATNPEAAETILTARALCKTFADGFHALINVDADFALGKVISILGQNGSGKTTLVKHLNGLYRPTSGTITYRGASTAGKSVAMISKDIILVFQNPELMLFEETVLRELTFCARAQGIDFSEEAALDVLNQYGLLDQKDDFPVNLSMGQKHLLTILSVLFSSAEVIILDEPTLGMDLFLRTQLEQIVAQLKARGKTVIVISHEIPMVFRISDEIVLLSEGIKLEQGSKADLAQRDELFALTNLALPPVVQLSKQFGFDHVCCDVASLVGEIMARTGAAHQQAAPAGGLQ